MAFSSSSRKCLEILGHCGCGDADAVPIGAAVLPGLVEEALLAAGSAHHPQVAVGYGQHGAQGFVHRVGYAGGFIDQQQCDGGKAAYGCFGAGEADNSGAVRQQRLQEFFPSPRGLMFRRRTNSSVFLRNSALWRSPGLATRTRLSGFEWAVWRALMAATVDFPHWRVQFRMPRLAVLSRTSVWRGSGSKSSCSRAKDTMPAGICGSRAAGSALILRCPA